MNVSLRGTTILGLVSLSIQPPPGGRREGGGGKFKSKIAKRLQVRIESNPYHPPLGRSWELKSVRTICR
jgi:hypothetical protein